MEAESAVKTYQVLQLVQRFERDAVIEGLCNVIVRLTRQNEELVRLRQENQELRKGGGPIGEVMKANWRRYFPNMDISMQNVVMTMSQQTRPVYEVFRRIAELSSLIQSEATLRSFSRINELSTDILCYASAGRSFFDRGS